jgi:imidazolonepropionase
MNADLLLDNIGQLVTPVGAGARGGQAQNQLRIETNCALAIKDGRIVWIGANNPSHIRATQTRDLGQKAVLPGLIDPHTHAVWAGNRLNDFLARASGDDYESILRAGGGIRSTIRATQAASLQTLVELALPRLQALERSGAATIEVKSGYGFDAASELKCLEAIALLAARVKARLLPTLLIHVPPQDHTERPSYLEMVTTHLIPEVAARQLATAVDVFIEREAFDLMETRTILETARRFGLAVKLHADQFHCVGGSELAAEMNALSVDHLEVSGAAQIAALAQSQTVATLLPGVSLHLGLPLAPARALLEAGVALAVGTDLNPGSSPLFSMQLALGLAVRLYRLSPAEALVACTVNAAAALGLHDCGRLEIGARADLLIVDSDNWLDLPYTLGANPLAACMFGGEFL